MLQAMRSGTKSPLMKGFLFFLAGGFAIWGIGDVSSGLFGPGDKAIVAGDESRGAMEVAQEFDVVRRTQLAGMTTGDALQAGVLDEIIGQMARITLLRAESNRLGIAVSRQMVRDAIRTAPAFQDDLGQFSEGRFLSVLSRAGLTEASFIAQLEDDIKQRQLLDPITIGGRYPTASAEAIAAFQLEKRTAKLVSFEVKPDDISDADNAVLAGWYAENSAAYDAAELREAEVVFASVSSLASQIEISAEALKTAFEERKDSFVTPPLRGVRQMLFLTEEEAKAALGDITSGQDFADVAEARLSWTTEDIQLGKVAADDLDPALAEVVFAANVGDIVGPVQTLFGYQIAIVDSAEEGEEANFDAVKAELEDSLKREQAFDKLFDRVNELEDAIGSGATLAEAAQGAGLLVVRLPAMDRNGRDIDGNMISADTLEGLVQDPGFVATLWELDVDEIGAVSQFGEDSYFVLQPVSETASRTRALAEVNARVMADWKTEQAIAKAKADAEQARTQASTFADIALSPEFTRAGTGLLNDDAGLIARAAFAANIGDIELIETGNASVLMQLQDIIPADQADIDTAADNLAQSLRSAVERDLGSAIAVELSERFDLQLYPERVQQILVGGAAQ